MIKLMFENLKKSLIFVLLKLKYPSGNFCYVRLFVVAVVVVFKFVIDSIFKIEYFYNFNLTDLLRFFTKPMPTLTLVAE